MTKQKKSSKRVKHRGRIASNRRFCPYNSHLKCPLIKGGCPLQDYDFVQDIRLFYCWNRGLKSLPLQPRVVAESGQVLESSQLIKMVDISNLFSGFSTLDWFSSILDAPKNQIRVTKLQCRKLRKAYRKWLNNLAPIGHRIIRYQH